MRRFAKKPKILKDKVKLSYLIKKNWTNTWYSTNATGYWWMGHYTNPEGDEVRISVQKYIRRLGFDFANLNWKENGKALTVTEIKDLLKTFEK